MLRLHKEECARYDMWLQETRRVSCAVVSVGTSGPGPAGTRALIKARSRRSGHKWTVIETQVKSWGHCHVLPDQTVSVWHV